MRWMDLKQKKEAPKSGWLLIYTRKEIMFHSYEDVIELDRELEGKELLEVHLFDRKKEYRCLSARSKRFPEGMIETVEDFEEMEEVVVCGQAVASVYAETIRLSEEWGGQKITVLNHLKFQETDGMAVVDNYRLKI